MPQSLSQHWLLKWALASISCTGLAKVTFEWWCNKTVTNTLRMKFFAKWEQSNCFKALEKWSQTLIWCDEGVCVCKCLDAISKIVISWKSLLKFPWFIWPPFLVYNCCLCVFGLWVEDAVFYQAVFMCWCGAICLLI